jgi:hypothetical protein
MLTWLPGAALLAVGALLRFWHLGDVPSPAGDEANWIGLGLDALSGRPTEIEAEAGFVTTLFGHLIALSFAVLGPSWHAARAVPALGSLLGVAGVLLLARRTGLHAAALAVAAFVLLHPWALFWSRSAAVPYALPFAIGVVGPLLWLAACGIASPWRRTVALVAVGQLLVLGLHFSPLGALPLVACGLWTLADSEARKVLRTPAPWLAVAGVALHAWPIVAQALSVAEKAVPDVDPAPFAPRLQHLGRIALDIVSGEATVRHFVVGPCAPVAPMPNLALVRWGTALLLLGAGILAMRHRVGRLGLVHLGVAAIGLPLLLVPARAWWLPSIDAERYGFALLAPVALVLGGMATRRDGDKPWSVGRILAGFVCTWLVLVPGLRAWRVTTGGHTADCGLLVADGGGGWRGWKFAQGPHGLPDAIVRAAHAAWPTEPATLLVDDWFGMGAVRASVRLLPRDGWTVDYVTHPPGADFRWPDLPPGRAIAVPVWAPATFAPGFQPEWLRGRAERLRKYVQSDPLEPRLATVIPHPDGVPLMELWVGRVPAAGFPAK